MPSHSLKERLELVELALGVAMTLCVVYMICPGIQSTVTGWWHRAIGDWRAQKQWEHERNQMAWETFMVKNADPARLAEQLEVE